MLQLVLPKRDGTRYGIGFFIFCISCVVHSFSRSFVAGKLLAAIYAVDDGTASEDGRRHDGVQGDVTDLTIYIYVFFMAPTAV